MLKFLAPVLLLVGLLVTYRWIIPSGYAFLMGMFCCLPLLLLTNRKVEAKAKYPWGRLERSSVSRNLDWVAVAMAFVTFLVIEYVTSDLPVELRSPAQFLAGAALSISVAVALAFVREEQVVKRQSK